MAALSERQRQILITLCRRHVASGRPVASAELCRAGLEWSSATIRSELASLERMELVHKPHAASGRVPSAKGWQIYVEALPRADARPEHQRLVDVSLGQQGRLRLAGGRGPGLRATARVLAEIAGCVAIGFVGESRAGVVEAIELVPVSSERALVVLTLDDGSSSMRTVEVDPEVIEGEGELRHLQGLLRELTLGRSLEHAREELCERLEVQGQRLDRLVAEALRIGLLLCAASYDPLWMQVAGQQSLLRGTPDGREGESLGELLVLLEDYQRLAQVLCQLLPDPGQEPRVVVQSGLDVSLPLPLPVVPGAVRSEPASGLTLVGCRLRWAGAGAGDPAGALALLGSPRMDYEALIPLVEYAARAMSARG